MVFCFLQGKMCAPEKSGASQRFCPPERARSASGAQFVQAYKWSIPHCVGAIDGKSTAIKAPFKSSTLFHNYKSFFSIVLMAICEANYCFNYVDTGNYGSNNDSEVLLNSKMGKNFKE